MRPACFHRRSGAVLIFSLLLLVVGALVLGGIAQVVVTQSLVAGREDEGSARRVTLENSRAMAREFILSRMFRGLGSVPAAEISFEASDELGGFVLPGDDAQGAGFWVAPPLQAESQLRINPFNLMERGGYFRAIIDGSLNSSSSTNLVPWSFHVRTRNPVAAGYSFVQHRPGSVNIDELAEEPYIDFGQPGDFFGFYGMPRTPVTSVTNTSATGDQTGYQGFIQLPPPNPDDTNYFPFAGTSAVRRPGDTNKALVTIDFSWEPEGIEIDDPTVLRYKVPSQVEVIDEVVDPVTGETNSVPDTVPVGAIEADGDPDGDGKASVYIIIADEVPDGVPLLLKGDNSRLVYITRQREMPTSTIFDLAFDSSSTWRLGLTAAGSPIQYEVAYGGSVTIQGGLRSSGGINPAQGEVLFVPEQAGNRGFDAVGERMMWLEDFRAR